MDTGDLLAFLARRRGELGIDPVDSLTDPLNRVLLASDLAFDVVRHDPTLTQNVSRTAEWTLDCAPAPGSSDFADALRRFRRRASVRLIARDVLGLDGVADTILGATSLAEICIGTALTHATVELEPRFGQAISSTGAPMQLAVIGMGKLGGGELNFSSDVDLILCYAEGGETKGPRSLSFEEYFTRIGQRLAQLLGDVTAAGFVARVDYRLRPFGTAGRVAWTFDAMEHYYQREGRDWERYAWIKARTVAGDFAGGAALIDSLRPFVYRRYLDFTAIEGLREMKSRIDHEVDRRELEGNLKLGPGGIRECEFIVQLAQMIRGGRESTLRTPSFHRALDAAVGGNFLSVDEGRQLGDAYAFLRRIENRVQMLGDEQTHSLPTDSFSAWRIAFGLGYADVETLHAAIKGTRAIVSGLFARVLDPPARNKPLKLGEHTTETPAQLIEHFGPEVAESFHGLLNSLPVKRMDTAAKSRFERATPRLLEEARLQGLGDAQVQRLLRLLLAIAGRSSYLALLAERRGARERVVDVFRRSSFLAERVIAHPLLLDDLLDERRSEAYSIDDDIGQHLARVGVDDAEAQLVALNEARLSALFRTGLDWMAGKLVAEQCSARLADIATACVRRVVALVQHEHERQHGRLGDGLLVVAYGSLGGRELGFASDLDLVFLYSDVADDAVSDGPKPLDRSRYFSRLAQRVLHWLGTTTRAGHLYDVDMRLRPDGAKGMLVAPLSTFAAYQRDRAWTYEQQALVRARVISGSEEGRLQFDSIRQAILVTPRDLALLDSEVVAMRERWRNELDRSTTQVFDLKQGEGGLVDMEFFVQRLVLGHASCHSDMTGSTVTTELFTAAERAGLMSSSDATLLGAAHTAWLTHSLHCTLDGRPRIVARDSGIDSMARVVVEFIR